MDQYFSDGRIQQELTVGNGTVIPDDGTVQTEVYNELVKGNVSVGIGFTDKSTVNPYMYAPGKGQSIVLGSDTWTYGGPGNYPLYFILRNGLSTEPNSAGYFLTNVNNVMWKYNPNTSLWRYWDGSVWQAGTGAP